MGCALLLQHGGGTSGSHGNGRRWPVMISDAGETGEEGMRGACSLLARPTADYTMMSTTTTRTTTLLMSVATIGPRALVESTTHNSTFLDEMSQLICRPLLQATSVQCHITFANDPEGFGTRPRLGFNSIQLPNIIKLSSSHPNLLKLIN